MLKLESGKRPWQVGDVFDVHNKFGHPTAGLMRLDDDEVVAFRCIAGVGELESLWAYAESPHYGEILTASSPTQLFQEWASRAGGIVVALVSDGDVIINTGFVKVGIDTQYSSYVELASGELGLSPQDREAIGID